MMPETGEKRDERVCTEKRNFDSCSSARAALCRLREENAGEAGFRDTCRNDARRGDACAYGGAHRNDARGRDAEAYLIRRY